MRKTSLFFLIYIRLLCAQSGQEPLDWFYSDELNETAIEYLDELLREPLNLNRATRQDLLRLPFLSPGQTDTLLEWRKLHGEFTSAGKVKALLGSETYTLLLPFIEISPARYPSYLQFRHYFKPQASATIQEKVNQLVRCRYDHGNGLVVGYVTQKDFGEPEWLDYASGYIAYYSTSWQGGAGRFRLSTGQGLLFSNPFSRQVSSMAMLPFAQQKNELRETLSSAENDNLFGLWMIRVWSAKWRSGFFYSFDGRDAVVGNESEISGFTDRYHISETDIGLKNKVDEQITGTFLEWKPWPGFQSTFTTSQVVYHPGFNRTQPNISEAELRRTYYSWTGQDQLQFSISVEHQSAAGVIQAEAAGGPDMSPAFNLTCFHKAAGFSSGLELWHITRNFQSPHGRYLGSASDFPRASQGIYGGMSYRLTPDLQADLSHLFSQDLWRSYFEELPLSRYETSIALLYKTEELQVSGKFRIMMTEEFNEILTQETNRANQYRLEISPAGASRWRWRSRIEMIQFNKQSGFNWFQEVGRRVMPGLDVTLRYSSFHTSGWPTRIYEYEPDLPGSFAIYPVSGAGSKWLVLLHYKLGRQYDFYFKWRTQLTTDREPLLTSFEQPAVLRDQQMRSYFRWNF